jgi:hypothetical protein
MATFTLGKRAEVSRADVDAVLEAPVSAASTPPQRGGGSGGGRPAMPPRDELVRSLTALRGDVRRLAVRYGKDAKQIYRWLKAYALDPADYR